MTIERTEVLWLESRTDYSVDELARMTGLPRALVDDLVDRGALPTAAGERVVEHHVSICFTADCVTLARAASRLREHFELDANGVAMAITLLRRVRDLEARLARQAAEGSG